MTIVSGKTRTRKAAAVIGAKKQVVQTHISKLPEGKGVRRKLLVGLKLYSSNQESLLDPNSVKWKCLTNRK